MNLNKKKIRSSAKAKRPEPAPADYCDEVPAAVLEEVKRVAASKDKKDEKWEIVHGPAW